MQNPSSDYLRVTDVLSPFSGVASIPKDILKRASERGTAVHEYCTAIIQGMPLIDVDEAHKGYIKSFGQWYCDIDYKDFEFPDRFYDHDLMITGECDVIYDNCIDGWTLVDFKTSARESKTWKYQGAAYAFMAKNKDINITRIEFVRLDKHGEAPIVYDYTKERSANWQEFMTLLEVYRKWFKSNPNAEYLEHL